MSHSKANSRRESVNQSLTTKLEGKQNKPKEMDRTPKTSKAQQNTPIASDSTIYPPSHEFDIFKSEIKAFFNKYDEKLDQKLSQFDLKFTAVFDDMKRELSEIKKEVSGVKSDFTEVKNKVNEMEKSIHFQSEMLEEYEEKRSDLFQKQRQELEELQNKILQQEKHDRRYNLLLYGFTEDKNKNLKSLKKTFFKEKLEIQEEEVDSMLFANYHRIPTEGK